MAVTSNTNYTTLLGSPKAISGGLYIKKGSTETTKIVKIIFEKKDGTQTTVFEEEEDATVTAEATAD